MEPLTFLLLAGLGAWVTLDTTAAGQFMVSRPLVAATLAGWIAGDPAQGALIGVLLESFHLTILPVGASRYPEGGSGAVVAGGTFAASGGGPASLLTVLVFALVWEWLAGESVRQLRHLNGRALPEQPAGPRRYLWLHWQGLAGDALRGLVLTLGGLVALAGVLFLRALVPLPPADWQLGIALAVVAGLTAASLSLFGGKAQTGRFAAGAGAGLLTALMLW
jgi:mannose PTS system EIIC component